MAAPKKYKTNTLKTPSAKKSSTRAASKKRPTSRVGATKLAKKSFFKPWMALPIIAVVALAGYAIVQFSLASGSNLFSRSAASLRGGMPYKVGLGDYGSGKAIDTKLLKGGTTAATGLNRVALPVDATVCAYYYDAQSPSSTQLFINNDLIGSKQNQSGLNILCGNVSGLMRTSMSQYSNSVKVKAASGWIAVTKIEARRGRVTIAQPYPNCNRVVNPPAPKRSTEVKGPVRITYIQEYYQNCSPAGQKTGTRLGIKRIEKTEAVSRPDPAQGSGPVLRTCNQIIKSETKDKFIDGGRTRVTYKRNTRQLCDSTGRATRTSKTEWFLIPNSAVANPNYRPSCNPNTQVSRDKTCVDATVYAKQVNCPKIDGRRSKSYTERYKGKNAYSCKVKIPNESFYKYAAPSSIVCFNSSKYVPKVLSEKWRYCGRR